MAIPHKCPVCNGTGKVYPTHEWTSIVVTCHACEGKGVLWEPVPIAYPKIWDHGNPPVVPGGLDDNPLTPIPEFPVYPGVDQTPVYPGVDKVPVYPGIEHMRRGTEDLSKLPEHERLERMKELLLEIEKTSNPDKENID